METVKHLNQQEVATRLGVCVGTLERWRRDGFGPRFLKLQSRVMYRVKDVEAYEQACLRESTSQRVINGGDA